ncbi:hypothetical protein [Streptomyces sp. NPDC093589]|uniref:hypothetical protein n=1 Tax=Streptomyces sp. NPDC093589 TaxID=3366043 RepID=UPI00381168C3
MNWQRSTWGSCKISRTSGTATLTTRDAWPRSCGLGRPRPAARPRELSAQRCVLYQIGLHRCLGYIDTVLADAGRLLPEALATPESSGRAATDTARALLDATDTAGAFTQLRLVELATPHEARQPSVRALTAQVVGRRPDLPGLAECAHRTLQHRGFLDPPLRPPPPSVGGRPMARRVRGLVVRVGAEATEGPDWGASDGCCADSVVVVSQAG